jgi:hypothetical protein
MPATAIKKKARGAIRKTSRKKNSPPLNKPDVSYSYNKYKEYEGKQYTGMQIGRSLKWYYDKGEWRDRKITPDFWEISYAVTKRRAGHAPKGSGAAVGTGYHWFIVAHQNVEKLNADDYSTSLSGFKYKLAHKRAGKEKWSITAASQKKHLIQFLKDMIGQLEEKPVPLEFEYEGKKLKGEAIPVKEACHDGVCFELDITLNDKHIGIIRRLKARWKMDQEKDEKFVDTIGDEITAWYE